ncbi:Flotillin [Paragonimus heterotremus]|uniref:Flotillin n=1 Tax=Paragonimus heterotremus TaxID=100268 RepID=A0A8J4SYT6_9TREM|nr:Flotillin [Paragonimus heterotremus]
MGNIHTVGPSEALVISGGCCGAANVRTIIGGWGWAWWCVTQVQKISLGVMTLNPKCENVETSEGVPLTVTGVAQVKVMRDNKLLQAACEQFLGRKPNEIQHTILQTMEGHLRAILGTLSVEAIYRDRDQFAALVRDVAAPDVGRMGIEILSFTIKDVYDRVEYLNSLGRAQTAVVKRDADIGVAEAERDAGIKEAECDRAKLDVRYAADTHIANSTRDFQMQKASFDQEVNTARAEAELAYQLQATKEKQKIRTEEVNISIVERRKQIEIEEKEILCSEKKMDATVRRPAEVEAYRLQQIAEGHRQQKILLAQAEADGIRARGRANAASILAIGNAEAERMKLRADAYNKYGEAAMLSLILDSLPRVAAEVAAPLSRTKEIVIMGGSCGNGSSGTVNQLTSLGRDFATMMGTVPQAVRALTDVDLSKTIAKIPGAQVSA